MVIAKDNIAALEQYLSEQGIGAEDLAALKAALNDEPEIEGKQFGHKVSDWVGQMMRKAASGAWKMAVGAGGKLIEKALWKYYGVE